MARLLTELSAVFPHNKQAWLFSFIHCLWMKFIINDMVVNTIHNCINRKHLFLKSRATLSRDSRDREFAIDLHHI